MCLKNCDKKGNLTECKFQNWKAELFTVNVLNKLKYSETSSVAGPGSLTVGFLK